MYSIYIVYIYICICTCVYVYVYIYYLCSVTGEPSHSSSSRVSSFKDSSALLNN